MEKQIYNRTTGDYYIEKQFMKKELGFLYHSTLGHAMLKLIVARRWVSRLYAAKYHTSKSVKKIDPFIKLYNICMDDYPDQQYKSFNDFFIRKPLPDKRHINIDVNSLISPADAKLLWLPITNDLHFEVKGYTYHLSAFLKDEALANRYQGGDCLVFRLTVDDCHRYLFVDDGKFIYKKEIPGKLHTVGPYSDGKNVFGENHRILSILDTRRFGRIASVEVGALLVGRIFNHAKANFSRGEEKGYFAYGGSTIVLLFESGQVKSDTDIRKHSAQNTEVKVRMGERIGSCL